MNVVFIVVDSLRTDHLGISGYSRKTSPTIDTLAKNGVFFKNTVSTIPRTSPSVASILTGLYPHGHGLRFLHSHTLNKSVTTLPEVLQAHDYVTVGQSVELIGTGLDRGFDCFNPISWRIQNKIKRNVRKLVDWKYKVDPAETLTNFGIKKINELQDQKFFLYLDYIDAHWPYDTKYSNTFDPDYTGGHSFQTLDGISRGDLIFNNPLSDEEKAHVVAHYDGAILFIDEQIKRLVEHLKSVGLLDDTLIVVTADHGECFGEHDMYYQHGEYLYDEGLRVPLIFHHKSLKHKIVEKQVQTTDIFPTILDLLKIPHIDKVDGESLVGGKISREYTFAETGRNLFKQNKRSYVDGVKGKWRMVRSDEWKLIFIPHPKEDIFELYNLKKDPSEKKNLIDSEKKIAVTLKKELFEWMSNSKEIEDADLTEKAKKLLKKLGYME